MLLLKQREQSLFERSSEMPVKNLIAIAGHIINRFIKPLINFQLIISKRDTK